MKILKKIIVYCLVICLFLGNSFLSYTFAEGDTNQEENKCYACNSTPTSMQSFINFEVELLGILQGASAQAEIFGTNKTSGLFAGGGLSLPAVFAKSVREKTKNDLDSEIKAARAATISAILLGVMGAEAKDSLYSIEILGKDEAFVRDYKTLQELDMTINDIIWDMGVSGIWNKRVTSSVKSEILGVQYKYAQMYGNENSIFKIFTIGSDVKYSNLSMFLLRLNSFMKSALMALGNDTPLLDLSVGRFENLYSKGNIIASFNEEYIESIKIDYSCVSLSTCSKSIKEARKGITNIDEYKEAFSRSKKTIQDAITNLKEAASSVKSYDGVGGWFAKKQKEGNIEGLTDRQIELLYMVYGIDAYELTTSQIESIKLNFEEQSFIEGYENTKDIVKKARDTTYTSAKGIVDLAKSWFTKITSKGKKQEKDYINNLKEQEKNELLSKIKRQTYIPISDDKLAFINHMQDAVNEILSERGQDKEILLVGVNNDVHYFVEIGEYIHSIVKNEIGDKNTEGLVKILGEICSYQCKNHGGKCYFE